MMSGFHRTTRGNTYAEACDNDDESVQIKKKKIYIYLRKRNKEEEEKRELLPPPIVWIGSRAECTHGDRTYVYT